MALRDHRAHNKRMADLTQLRTDLAAIRAIAAEHGDNPRHSTLVLLDAIDRVGVEALNELTVIRETLQRIAAQGERDA